MSYDTLITAHRQLPHERQVALTPTLSDLLEGRLSAFEEDTYLLELQLETPLGSVHTLKA